MHSQAADLARLQRWMQAMIRQPGMSPHSDQKAAAAGAVPAEGSSAAGAELVLEDLVRSTPRFSAQRRMAVYASAYFARLTECLQAEFPLVCQALGEEFFQELAWHYLSEFPSRSSTLGQLGSQFAEFLAAQRDHDRQRTGQPSAIDFVVDLARLEWAIAEVYDGPGLEGQPAAGLDWDRIPKEAWPDCRCLLAPSVRLLSFECQLSVWVDAAKRQEFPGPPRAGAEYVLLFRGNYQVRRQVLRPAAFQLLHGLQAGKPLWQAFAAAAETAGDPGELQPAQVQAWFAAWAADRIFQAVIPPQ